MGYIDEALGLIRKGRVATKDLDELSKFNTRSIARRAQESTFQFTCLGDNTIPFGLMTTVIKNLDRIYASFVQTVVASDPLIDISIDRGPLDYMKRMHQNMKLESAMDLGALDERSTGEVLTSYIESVCPGLEVSSDFLESTIAGAYDGRYQLYLDPTGSFGVAFSESVLTDLTDDDRAKLKEYLAEFDLESFTATEADIPSKSDILAGIINATDDAKSDMMQRRQIEIGRANGTNAVPKMVDRDAKRINELVPYGLQVRLMAVNDKKEFVQFIDFIIGVKTILHVCTEEELVTNIAYTLQNKNALFNFVRWTTGEISLMKDLILHVNDAKYNNSYKSRQMSSYFPNLRRMKEKKITVGTFGIHKLVPNATIVLSQYGVDDLRTRHGFDIHDVAIAKKMMRDLFLMTFIIVDEGAGTMEILYENNTFYETYSLESLEKEMDMSSNKLGREIGRMISQ